MTRFLKQEPITIFFLAITTVVFMAMQLIYGPLATSSQAVYQFGGMLGLVVKVMPNQLWRLVTPIFIHIGWGHFFVNALTLYFVGRMAEEIWGVAPLSLALCFFRNYGECFYHVVNPRHGGCWSVNVLVWSFCCHYGFGGFWK